MPFARSSGGRPMLTVVEEQEVGPRYRHSRRGKQITEGLKHWRPNPKAQRFDTRVAQRNFLLVNPAVQNDSAGVRPFNDCNMVTAASSRLRH